MSGSSILSLLHFESLVDDSAVPGNITLVASASLSTTQVKVGTKSLAVNIGASTTDALTVTYASPYSIGTGDFTVEAWIYPTAVTSFRNIVNYNAYNNGIMMRIQAGKLDTYVAGTQVITANTVFSSANTWYHVAMSRTDGTVRLFVNGVVVAERASTTGSIVGGLLNIGAANHTAVEGFKGYIDEVRVSTVSYYASSYTFAPPTTAFPNAYSTTPPASNTVTLLHFENLVDNGATPGSVSLCSGATLSRGFSKFGKKSLAVGLNGSALDSAVVVYDSPYSIGTGDFTAEAWVYPTTVSGYLNVINYNTYVLGIILRIQSGKLEAFAAGSQLITTTAVVTTTNTWHHVAFSRQSGTLRLFLNGVVVATGSSSSNVTAGIVRIGAANHTDTEGFQGYIDEVRISSTARYTAAFTPPTASFSDDGMGKPNTPTLTLLHFEDLVDNGNDSGTIGLAGAATLSTASPKFGTKSLYITSNSDFLTVAYARPPLIGRGDFTVEAWIYPTMVSGSHTIMNFNVYTLGITLRINAGRLDSSVAGNYMITSTAVCTVNNWYHVAVCRASGTGRIFCNGVMVASTSTNEYVVTDTVLSVGMALNTPNEGFRGYIDEFRLTNNAQYTSNFTPPTAPFSPTDAGGVPPANITVLQLDDTLDRGVAGGGVTLFGSASLSTAKVKTGTKSLLLTSSADYLSVTYSGTHNIRDGDFTAEAWVNPTSLTGIRTVINYNSYTNGILFSMNASKIQAYVVGTLVTSTTDCCAVANVWYHVAVSRFKGMVYLFCNGVVVGKGSAAGNITGGLMMLGRASHTTAQGFTGYIDQARITVNALTRNHAVPTTPYTSSSAPLPGAVDTRYLFTFASTASQSMNNSKFGASSLYSNNNGCLTVGSIPTANMASDWTVECWLYTTSSTASQVLWNFYPASATDTNCVCSVNAGVLSFMVGTGNTKNVANQTPTTPVAANTWHHIALVHSGTSYMAYLNGTRFMNTTSIVNIDASIFGKVNIGSGTGTTNFLVGYIDEFRLSSSARYTGTSFTPPSDAFSSDSDTVMLLHLDAPTNSSLYMGHAGSGALPAITEYSGVLIGNRPPLLLNKAHTMVLSDYSGGNQVLQTQTNKSTVNSLTMSISDLSFNSSTSKTYAPTTYSNAVVSQFTITASDTSGTSITNFSSDNISLTLSLPNADKTDSLSLYKLDSSGGTSLMDPQPTGYPTALTYSSSTKTWSSTITSLSTFAVLSTAATHTYTFTGLVNGAAYTFRVAAVNYAGTGSYSSSSSSATPYTTPSAPTSPAVTLTGGVPVLSWTAASNGGSAITGYAFIATKVSDATTVTATTTSTSTSYSFSSGLTYGSAYTFTVAAVNAAGTGSYSASTTSVTPAAAPATPTSVTATAVSSSSATISWTAPSSNGSTITGYTVVSSPATTTQQTSSGGTTSSMTFTGLTAGATYTFTVAATNAIGTSSYSTASPSLTMPEYPGAPTIGTATASGDLGALVTWTAPTDTGGSPILGYYVYSTPTTTTQTFGSGATSGTFTGLAYGTSYTFKVAAYNVAGPGFLSSSSSSVTPYTTPGAPIGVSASISVSTTTATVSWTAPTSSNGSTITSYKVRATNTNDSTTVTQTTNLAVTTYQFTGLSYGVPYTFTVAANNGAGTGAYSSSSASITPYTKPGTPSGVTGTVTASSKTVEVSWTAPADNGRTISQYTVKVTNLSTGAVVSRTSTTTSYSAADLDYGVAYTFTVAATNSVGTGTYSTATTTYTPYTVPAAPTGASATVAVNTNVAVVSWTAPTNTYGSSVTGYTIVATDAGTSATTSRTSLSTSTSYSFSGLTYGSYYTFTVAAINAAGTGAYSISSSSVRVTTVPDPPTSVTASVSADSKQATVSWTVPASDGGSTITGYYVRSTPTTTTQRVLGSASSSLTFTGLAYGTSYTFVVAAYNGNGTGSYSSSSGSVTPYASTPGAPTIGVASVTDGATSATVRWTAPTTGTASLAGYYIRSTPTTTTQTASSTASSMTFTGLTAKTSYTFAVSAYNVTGTEGSASSASNTVTPTTTPSAPTAASASIGTKSQYATVTWSAPADNGGASITSYQITSIPPTYIKSAASTSASYSFGPLTYGTTYTFYVAAVNAAGLGTALAASSTVTPSCEPGTPAIGTASVTNSVNAATITWTAPSSNGSTILGYYVTSTPATTTKSASGTATSLSFTGLTYGTSYTFNVAAYNAVGTGLYSSSTTSVTPIRYPGTPTIGTVTGSGATATVLWTPPTYTGGSKITGYYVVSSPATTTQSASSSATSLSFTGLSLGTSYTFSVAAFNAAGTGEYSSSSGSVLACTAPGSPTIGTATVEDGATEATVTWTAPSSTGGSDISSYTVVSSPATTTQTTTGTSIIFTGLSHGVAYTFTVAATNVAGTGSYSSSSNSVYSTSTPSAPTSITATTAVDETAATISWTAPADTGGLPITGYVVVSTPETSTFTAPSSATSVTFTGLTFFTGYTFRVAAQNSLGTGTYSAASETATPFYYRVTATTDTTLTSTTDSSTSAVSLFMGSTSETAVTFDISINPVPLVTADTGFKYVDDSTYTSFVLTATFNAYDGSGNKVTDFSNDPIFIQVDIPHVNTSNTLKVFKLNDAGTVLVPQPSGYPRTVAYNSSTGYWEGTLTRFSEYAFVDIGQGTTGATSGGDPHVRTVDGVYTLLPNSWKRVRMYEKDETKVVVKCRFAPDELLEGMHIIEDDVVLPVTSNFRKQWLAESLTFMYEMEIIHEGQVRMRVDLFTGRVKYSDGTFQPETPRKPWGLYSITGNMRYPPVTYVSYDIVINEDGDYISVDVDPYWDDVNNLAFNSNRKSFGPEYTGEFFRHSPKNDLTLR